MAVSKNGSQSNTLVPAVDRAAHILRVVASVKTPLGVSELSRRLGLNKSTTHDILTTLCHHHLLERDEPTKTYRLGYALAELGQHVDERLDLRTRAHARMIRLSDDVDETVFLGTYRDGYVTIIDKQEASHDVKITSPVGGRMHYSAAAFGKLFLAAMNDAELNRLLTEKPLRPSTPRSIVKPNAYRSTLRQVRAQGYALDDEEYLPGVRAVSAPVNDAQGHVIAALCVVGFGSRMVHDKLAEIARETRRAAESISRELGAPDYPAWNGVG